MEVHTNGDVNADVKDAVTGDGAKFSGWLLHFIPGNWFRRKWVKRWVVLRDESLYMYESQQTNNNNKKNFVMLDLMKYETCGDPDKNKLKKKPNSFLIELDEPNRPDPNLNVNKKKIKYNLRDELFDAENESERTKWLEKINDAIKTGKQLKKTNLSHVTKSRAVPRNVRRRPPSRHHLREVATQSQLLPGIDFNIEISPESVRHASEPTGSELASDKNPSENSEVKPRSSSVTHEPAQSSEEVDGCKADSQEPSECSDKSPAIAEFLSLPRPSNTQKLELEDHSRSTSSLDRRSFTHSKLQNCSESSNEDKPLTPTKSPGFKLPGLVPGQVLLPRDIKAKSITIIDQCEKQSPTPSE